MNPTQDEKNVVDLKLIRTQREKPTFSDRSESMIGHIKDLLAAAEEGRVIDLVVAYTGHDDDGTEIIGSLLVMGENRRRPYALVGGVEEVKQRLLKYIE